MTSAVWDRTPNLGLGLIQFSFPNWADDANLNTRIIDAAMSVIGVSVKGAWANNTPYNPGDLVVDPDLNTIWRAAFAHVSSASGTMAEERVNHPTYWNDASLAIHARGQWTTVTSYYVNDVVYDGYAWGLVTNQYTSGASFAADVTNGDIVIIVDNTDAVDAAEDAADAADADRLAAAASASASAASATSSQNSASAAAISASNAGASQNAAATSAADAQSSENDAEAAQAAAEAALAAMLPDAVSNGKYYGRRNAAWAEVVGEAPVDGALYARKDGGWVQAVGVVVSDTEPPLPRASGLLWFESDTGNTFMWYTAPQDPDSSQWIQISGYSAYATGAGGGIAEAPHDGNTYARRDSAWVNMGGAVPVNEAPMDGQEYTRKNGAWVVATHPAFPAQAWTVAANGDALYTTSGVIRVRVRATDGFIRTASNIQIYSSTVVSGG